MGEIIINNPTCIVKLSDTEIDVYGKQYERLCKLHNFIYEEDYTQLVSFERFCIKRIIGNHA